MKKVKGQIKGESLENSSVSKVFAFAGVKTQGQAPEVPPLPPIPPSKQACQEILEVALSASSLASLLSPT